MKNDKRKIVDLMAVDNSNRVWAKHRARPTLPKQGSLIDYWLGLGMKEDTNKESTMRGRLVTHGFRLIEPAGKGYVIGTGRPVAKKDDEAT